MQVIALTETGCLISASSDEVKEIINAVSGNKPEKLQIGQKIPAIDYASTITKIKSLEKDYDFKNLIRHGEDFTEKLRELNQIVLNAAKLEG
jgi:hypothetical protein